MKFVTPRASPVVACGGGCWCRDRECEGAVSGDKHISQTNGWAPLRFWPVTGAGIRAAFSNTTTALRQNHYRTCEVEVPRG
ncbi:MAG: hypothetical protein U0Q16_28805 [Bryobacteraceae bacterium]